LTVAVPYNNTPFKVSVDETLTLNAVMASYTFLRWDDGSTIVSLDAATAALSMDGYTGAVTFTANFATAANTLTVTLISVPTGASLFYTIGNLDEKLYEGTPFKVAKNEVLSTKAEIAAGYTFLRWDDGSKIISFSDEANSIVLSGYGSSVTFYARYTSSGSTVTVTLDSVPPGASLSYTIGSLTVLEPYNDTPFLVSAEETLVLNAAAMASYNFQEWDDGSMTVSGTAKTGALSVDEYPGMVTFTANYIAKSGPGPTTPPKQYIITATATGGASISPSGTVGVSEGSNRTFFFSASQGYHVSDVTVDGVALSLAEIALGSYTFTNVNANHTIKVTASGGQGTAITLTVSIVEGSGHAEFSINGAPFQLYTVPVYLHEHDDVVLRAFADDGYEFGRWDDVMGVHRNSDYSVYDTMESLFIELHFTRDGEGGGGDGGDGGEGGDGGYTIPPWILVPLILLAGLFFWFILFYRRYYDVIKPDVAIATVVGKNRVHRKNEYEFTIPGGFSGTVSYRVGEDGVWKTIRPGEEGMFIIPEGEIIDDVTIECIRPWIENTY
ncbi:MAG: hypothetical protein FWF40_02685, partial [Methanomassiliicoccaceae archaeon]|nr:hypothetical protein [Methanomassiliicoccaceae archaeon]